MKLVDLWTFYYVTYIVPHYLSYFKLGFLLLEAEGILTVTVPNQFYWYKYKISEMLCIVYNRHSISLSLPRK